MALYHYSTTYSMEQSRSPLWRQLLLSTFLLLLVCALNIALSSPLDALYIENLGGTGTDSATDAVEDGAGGIVFVGSTTSFGAGASDIWAARLDSSGAIVWQKSYGTAGNEGTGFFSTLVRNSSGNFVIAAPTFSFGAGSFDIWVFEVAASDGSIIQQKSFGGAGIDAPGQIIQAFNGDYVLAARTTSFGAGGNDVWILRLDANLNIIWQKTYGSSSQDFAFTLVELPGSGEFAIGASSQGFGALNSDYWIFVIDSSGSIVSGKERIIQSTGPSPGFGDVLRALIRTSDGNLLAVGFGSTGHEVYLNLLDANLNLLDTLAWGGDGASDQGSDVIQTADGNFVIAGFTGTLTPTQSPWAFKIQYNSSLSGSSLGPVLWEYAYGNVSSGAFQDALNAVIEIDGKLHFVGKESFAGSGGDVFILRTDANGLVGPVASCGSEYPTPGRLGLGASGGVLATAATVTSTSVVPGVPSIVGAASAAAAPTLLCQEAEVSGNIPASSNFSVTTGDNLLGFSGTNNDNVAYNFEWSQVPISDPDCKITVQNVEYDTVLCLKSDICDIAPADEINFDPATRTIIAPDALLQNTGDSDPYNDVSSKYQIYKKDDFGVLHECDIDFLSTAVNDGTDIQFTLDPPTLDTNNDCHLCSFYILVHIPDSDGDGVSDFDDQCPDSVPDNIALNPNQYAQNDFSNPALECGSGVSSVYTSSNTFGCTCKQIVEILGLGAGHIKKGCSAGIMQQFTGIAHVDDQKNKVCK